jgi:hypothetical protein
LAHFSITKLIELPTANMKEGNTRSVGVNPFHEACDIGCVSVSGCIYNDHETNCHPPENIKGKKALRSLAHKF